MIKEQSLQEILASYNAASPLQEASTIPGPWYTDPRMAELELKLFSAIPGSWLAKLIRYKKPGQLSQQMLRESQSLSYVGTMAYCAVSIMSAVITPQLS